MIVIACNTATVTGIDYFRKAFPDIPIVGVVPVIKTGAEKSNMKKFAVLSTERTAKSVYQQHLISSFANDCAVFSVGNTDLVSLIENGKKDSKEVKTLLEKVLIPLTDKKIDVLVLGCTHFPFLRTAIQKIVGPQILVLDSGDAVARQVKHILGHEDIQSSVKKPLYQFFTTGNPQNVSMVASHLLQKAIVFTRVLGF